MQPLTETYRRRRTLTTHRIRTLPVLVLMAHSRCNCKCVMCDIWKANANGREISADDLAPHMDDLQDLGVRWVVLSGGEPLLHSNLWLFCEQLKQLDVKITLLSTGILLTRYAKDIVRWCDEVTVSLDGSRQVHDAIRRVPNAYDRLVEGVAAIKSAQEGFRVTARCVLQRENFRDLPNIIASARDLELDEVSFLAADVSTEAFNRPDRWDDDRVAEVALTRDEVSDFTHIVEETIERHAAEFASEFIAESPDKLRRIPRYYAALLGADDFPRTVCNAPWVSTVIEADGTVRPCFFHSALGSIHEKPLASILNSREAISFRRGLDVTADEICRKCVCTLHLSPHKRV